MKKDFEKMMNEAMKKNKPQVKQTKKLLFSTYKEDFVITKQEEMEGGFFGSNYFKTVPT